MKEIASYYGTTNFLKEKQQYSNSIYEAIKSACKANRYSLLREFRHLNGQYFGSGCQASFMVWIISNFNDCDKRGSQSHRIFSSNFFPISTFLDSLNPNLASFFRFEASEPRYANFTIKISVFWNNFFISINVIFVCFSPCEHWSDIFSRWCIFTKICRPRRNNSIFLTFIKFRFMLG